MDSIRDHTLARSATRRVTGILLAAVLCACHQGESAGKTGIAWLDAPADPVDVSLTFDSANAVSRVITSDGGALSAAGDDGTFFTLQIPKGALASPERITMIPVRHVDGLPLEGGALATVQIEPEGLILYRPATLFIETPQPISPAERVAFAYDMHGRDTHLYTATGDSLETEMKLLHFSGYGFGKAAPNDPGRLHLLFTEKVRSRLEARLAKVISENKGGDESVFWEAFSQALLDYYDGIVRPLMKVAEKDDRMAVCALQAYFSWLHQLAVMGANPDGSAALFGGGSDPTLLKEVGYRGELARRMQEGSVSALAILYYMESKAMERARKGCRQHDLTAYANVLSVYGFFQAFGIAGKQPEAAAPVATIMEEFSEKCLLFEVDLFSEIESRTPHSAQHFQVETTVPYGPDDDSNHAPLSYNLFTTSGRPMEDLFGAYAPKKDGTVEDALRTTAEIGLNYDLSAAGSRPGTVRIVKIELGEGNLRDTSATNCLGRDEDAKMQVFDTVRVTLRIDPPTEIVHFKPVHAGKLRPFNSDMHQWMLFFTQFRKAANHDIAPPADAAGLDAYSGEQAQILTVEVIAEEPGVWRAKLTTPDRDSAPDVTLKEMGYIVLRHTPKT